MLIGNITKRPEITYFSNSEMTGNYFVLIPRIKVFLRHNLMHILWVFFTFKAFPGTVWDIHIFVRIIDQCYITMYIPCSCYQGFFAANLKIVEKQFDPFYKIFSDRPHNFLRRAYYPTNLL